MVAKLVNIMEYVTDADPLTPESSPAVEVLLTEEEEFQELLKILLANAPENTP